MNSLHDTQPNMRPVRPDDGPPKILLYGVVGIFLLVVIGVIAGVVAFREVLSPGQQQRVMDMMPFMRVFKEPTPMGGVLPTVEPNPTGNADALNLLNLTLASATPSASEGLATDQPTIAPTLAPTQPPTPTFTPTQSSAAAIPTDTVINVVQPVATALPAVVNQSAALPMSGHIYGIRHEQQKWNNCGPATLTMGLSFYGWQDDQTVAAAVLKPNREDKNVGPDELANFVNTRTGVRAVYRIGGDVDLLRALVAAQFPVIIEMGASFEAYDWLGHYRLLVGYDHTTRYLYFYDSFQGTGEFEQGVAITYDDVDSNWKYFNRTFIVIYQQDRENELRSILGTRWEEQGAAQVAFETAQQEAKVNLQDGLAWFNIGTALVKLGRYVEAANAFDQARRYDLPWRMLWYQFGPFVAYYETGRYEEVLVLAEANLLKAPEHEESYYWRGKVYIQQGSRDKAASDFRRALGLNPNYVAAQQALDTLGS